MIDNSIRAAISPFDKFESWYEQASDAELEANAMTISTVDQSNHPSSRVVLLKSFHNKEFVFYTNFESKKGRQIQKNPAVSICFHWKSIKKQIRIQGIAEAVDDSVADEYFATRDRASQIGAWASAQSRSLTSRESLEKSIKLLENEFANKTIPRPHYWSGFRVKPSNFEFWEEMPHRLHKRIFYQQDDHGNWKDSLLFP
tara:strand:- start:148 stop:747 length:600 start_codon:yes stop_codon:yes gene_type:complete